LRTFWLNFYRGYREKHLFRSLTKHKEIITKTLEEKEDDEIRPCDEEDPMADQDTIAGHKMSPMRQRSCSVDSEPMLTIDDSVVDVEGDVNDTAVKSELKILELAEQLEERLFVAFLHSKVC